MSDSAKKISKDTINFSAKEFIKRCINGAFSSNGSPQNGSSTVIGGGSGRTTGGETTPTFVTPTITSNEENTNTQTTPGPDVSSGTPTGFVSITSAKNSSDPNFLRSLSAGSKASISKYFREDDANGYSITIGSDEVEIIDYIKINYLNYLHRSSSPVFSSSGSKWSFTLAKDIDVKTSDNADRKMDISFVHSKDGTVEKNNIYIKFKKDDANKLKKAIIAIPVKSPIFKISEMSYSNK